MNDIYENLLRICSEKDITAYKLCVGSGIPKNTMTEMKKGRKKTLSADTLNKISKYLNVSVDEITGSGQATIKPEVDENDVKVALFGGDDEVTDAMWEEALFAVELIKQRHKQKKEKETDE